MKTVRMILSLLRSLIERDGDRRRERVERTPVVEPMEPRALLSGMEPGGAIVVPPHHSGGELVIPIHQNSSCHVMYQINHEGGLIASVRPASVETAPTSHQGTAQTSDMTTADGTDDDSSDDPDDDNDDDPDGDGDGGDDDDGDGGDDDNDDDDNGDEIDDENDP